MLIVGLAYVKIQGPPFMIVAQFMVEGSMIICAALASVSVGRMFLAVFIPWIVTAPGNIIFGKL